MANATDENEGPGVAEARCVIDGREYLSVQQAAELLNQTYHSVWRNRERIPHVKIRYGLKRVGYFFERGAFEEWAKARRWHRVSKRREEA